MENKKSWHKTWWGIIVLILFWPFSLSIWIWKQKWQMYLKVTGLIILWIFVLSLINTSSNNNTKENKPQEDNKSSDIKSVTKMDHAELLKISKQDPNSILNKSYPITLYLEQRPTKTQADFMSQPDDNDANTILIFCKMDSNDLQKLDGESAEKRIYKPYTLEVTFIRYDSEIGLSYEANCVLK